MAGMEMSCGRASSVTEACPRWRVVRMVRRVGSLRAEKVASRLVEYLTIRLCILKWDALSRGTCQGLRSPLNIHPSSADRDSSRNRTLRTEPTHEVTHPRTQRPYYCHHPRGSPGHRANR